MCLIAVKHDSRKRDSSGIGVLWFSRVKLALLRGLAADIATYSLKLNCTHSGRMRIGTFSLKT